MTPHPEVNSPDPTLEAPAERGSAWRIFLIPAFLAVVGYFGVYAFDAHLRHRHGPWIVQFRVDPDGTPALSLSQPSLGLTNIQIRFAGEKLDGGALALPATMSMDSPETTRATPFGRVAFHDLTYLPGTVVLHCFGHEVQMIPKGLFLNRQPYAWESGATLEMRADSKLATLDPPTPPRRPLMIPAMGPPRREPAPTTPPE